MSKRTNLQDSSLLLDKIWRDLQDDSYKLKAQEKIKQGKPSSDPKWLILIVLTIGGLIFGIGASITRQSIPLSIQNRDLLRENIAAQSIVLEDKETQLEQVIQSISTLQENQAAVLPEVDQEELTLLNFASGYQTVSGPGIRVEINDAEISSLPLDVDPSLARVFDSDLITILNGLWVAGAEAVAIGNQRISSRSAVSQSGEAILVNYRPILPPYRIDAIGSPELADRFKETQDFMNISEVTRLYGISFNVDSIDNIEIPIAVLPIPDLSGLTIGQRN
ncbi:MAG: DUF881 domain-containing protein [Candidatus Nanopelagicales bacterium]